MKRTVRERAGYVLYSGSDSTENSHISLTPRMRVCDLNPYKKRRQYTPPSVYLVSDVCVDEILVQAVTRQQGGHPQDFIVDELAPSPMLMNTHRCRYCTQRGTAQGQQYFVLFQHVCASCDRTICPALSVCSQCYDIFFPEFHCATCHA